MKILNLYAGIGGNRMLWGDALRNMVKPEDGKFIFQQLTKDTKC